MVAVRFLNVSLEFAAMTSDGVLRLCRFSSLPRRQAPSNNTYELIKLTSLQTFEELNNQLRLRQINLRGSTCLQTRQQSSQLESAADSLQILWPKRILMKVASAKSSSSAPSMDRFFAECELSIVRVFPSCHPMVRRDFTPIVQSNVLPSEFRDLVPAAEGEVAGQVQMRCERYCYFVDRLVSAPGQLASTNQNNYWISYYDFATD